MKQEKEMKDDIEDLRKLSRELWAINQQIANRQEDADESRQVIKSLKDKRIEIVDRIAKIGQFVQG